MKDPARILLVRMSHLGDVACALPVFHALREAHPGAEIGWVVQPEFAGLIGGMAGLQRVFRFDRHDGLRGWFRLRSELRAFRPDLAVDAQGNLKSALALWCSGAPRRAGLHPDDWRERTGARVINEPAPASGAQHAIERMLALATHLGPDTATLRCDLALTDLELLEARDELRALFPAGAEGVRLLHLSSPHDVRAWQADRFGSLALRLRKSGHPVAVVSGPAEEEAGLSLARNLGEGSIRHLVGQRDLRRLAALFAAASEVGGLFLGADSGPMNVACASGLAVVCLEGPQDGGRTGPWTREGPSPASVLRASDGPDCAPCLRRRCDHREGPVCMSRIEVDAVAQEALRPRAPRVPQCG